MPDAVQLLVDRAYIFPEHEKGYEDQPQGDQDDDPNQVGKLCAPYHAEILHKILFDAKLGHGAPEVQIFSVDNDADRAGQSGGQGMGQKRGQAKKRKRGKG